MTIFFSWPTLMRRFSGACMPNFVALGCLEVGEKFLVGGWGGGHFDTNNHVTPTLSWVRLRLGWAVTIC